MLIVLKLKYQKLFSDIFYSCIANVNLSFLKNSFTSNIKKNFVETILIFLKIINLVLFLYKYLKKLAVYDTTKKSLCNVVIETK